MSKKQTFESISEMELVDDQGLLEALFPDAKARPSARWLRKMRDRRLIPFLRIGGSRTIRFSVRDVRAALDRQFKVEPKHSA